jgi:hypothetical protein
MISNKYSEHNANLISKTAAYMAGNEVKYEVVCSAHPGSLGNKTSCLDNLIAERKYKI